MAEFFSYLRNITYYLLFAALVNMAAPNGKYLRYIRLVTGLILVAMLFAPLTSLLRNGMSVTPVTDLFAKMAPVPATANGGLNTSAGEDLAASLEQQQYEAVQILFEDQLRRQLSGLLTQNDCTLREASFDYAPDFSALYHISVEVSTKPKSSSRPFIYIEPVRIPTIGGTGINSTSSDAGNEEDGEGKDDGEYGNEENGEGKDDGEYGNEENGEYGNEHDGEDENDEDENDEDENEKDDHGDEDEDDQVRAIKKWIADFYNLSTNHIDVRVIYE